MRQLTCPGQCERRLIPSAAPEKAVWWHPARAVKEHHLRATSYLSGSVEALGEELVDLVSRDLARRVVSSDE